MPTEDHISALERLAKLKAERAISDADFEAQKARLMGAAADQVQPKPKKPWRTIALVAAAIWAVALLAKAIFHPGDWGTDTDKKAVQTAQTAAIPPEKTRPDKAPAALQPEKVASAAQPVPGNNMANATPAQDNAAHGQGSQGADPLEGRYSAQFHQCMAGEDAAGGSTSAMAACTNQELNVQVTKLNETYKGLMMSMETDKQADLRDAERSWLNTMRKKCLEADNEPDAQIAALEQPSCMLSQTIERTMALEKLQAQSGQPQ